MGKYTPSVAVVIPFYRATLSPAERRSLQHWQKYLSTYDTYTVGPAGLRPPHSKIKSVEFDAEYFTSIRGYSKLLVREEFYAAFEKYDYILIYQLDAVVFRDELKEWCQKGLSYIGAPWFATVIGFLTSTTRELRGGNGGLSLRSVPKSLKVLRAVSTEAKFNFPHRWQQWLWFGWSLLCGRTHQKWLACSAEQYPFNEDGFWSFEAPKYTASFRAATQQESLQFAFETEPRKCFDLNGKKLPFGVHAWQKYDPEFWQEYIRQ